MCLIYFSQHCKHHIMELQELQRKWLLRAKLKTFIVTQTRFYQLAQAESFVIHLPQICLQREAKLLPLNTKLQKKNISWSSPARAKVFLGQALVPSSAETCSSLILRTDFNKHNFLLFKGAYLNASSSKCAGYF